MPLTNLADVFCRYQAELVRLAAFILGDKCPLFRDVQHVTPQRTGSAQMRQVCPAIWLEGLPLHYDFPSCRADRTLSIVLASNGGLLIALLRRNTAGAEQPRQAAAGSPARAGIEGVLRAAR